MIQIDLLLKNLVSRLYSHGTKARADPVQGSLLEPGKAPTRLSAMEGYGSETYAKPWLRSTTSGTEATAG